LVRAGLGGALEEVFGDGGDGAGELRAEDADAVADADDGPAADRGVVREAAGVLEREDAGVLGHRAAAGGADGADEADLLGPGEEHAGVGGALAGGAEEAEFLERG